MRKNTTIPKRQLQPDYRYNNPLVTKMVNYVMRDGKKETARKIVYSALEEAEKKTKTEAMTIFDQALKNVSPEMEVRSKRIGGANYQVPYSVKGERRTQLAMRWIITAAKSKKGMPMESKLADEFIAAYKNEGDAVKKREHVEKMASANRAFAHFA